MFIHKQKLNICRKYFLMQIYRPYSIKNRPKREITQFHLVDASSEDADLEYISNPNILKYCKDLRIIYSCITHKEQLSAPFYLKKKIRSRIVTERKKGIYRSSVPLVVEQILQEQPCKQLDESNMKSDSNQDSKHIEQFPYSKFEAVNTTDLLNAEIDNHSVEEDITMRLKTYNESKKTSSSSSINKDKNEDHLSLPEDISLRLKTYNEKKRLGATFPQVSKHPENDPEIDLKFFEDTLLADLAQDSEEIESYVNQHGTPDPSIAKSSVPCGGCGALLHCQDEALPGYTPSQLFRKKSPHELRNLLCQRCIFLKKHNAALNIRVSPEVYERALKPITYKKALIMVVVDIIDTPCSIWPGLFKLVGTKQPVVVIGNKVDLLPLDDVEGLTKVRASLIQSIKETSMNAMNICHIGLVSAKTGYGIEDLISKIQMKWGIKGDVYIVGCTNAGKSTVFNALLRSDLCKVKASNLIRRATASPWPGTTLNLLKFPMMKPTGNLLTTRIKRLDSEREEKRKQESLNPPTKSIHREASLTGHIGQSLHDVPTDIDDSCDPFQIIAHKIPKTATPIMGIDEQSEEYANSKWCCDTPGTIQPDQFLGLLTHDELLDVLPRKMILPRPFALRPSQTLFIAGLVRLDLLYTPTFVRMIVCCSSALPVTIVPTSEASSVHRSYLGSDLLQVPRGSQQRLDRWPPLKPTNIRIRGNDEQAVADIVLSSAGFIVIMGEDDIDLRGWTPGGRGVFVRVPSLLPDINKMVSKRITGTPRYNIRNQLIST